MPAPFILIRSAMPGMVWPAIATPQDATALALQYQLGRSQWLPAAELRALQSSQLEALLAHAHETVPFYRRHWEDACGPGRPPAPERLSSLPLLARGDLQSHFEALKSNRVPPAHGRIAVGSTSGSTGRPVRTLRTDLMELWWRTLTLRDHLWHRRDFPGKLAAIRQSRGHDETPGWGPATDAIANNGPSATLNVATPVAAQLEWLMKQQPAYLLTYPSIVAELARLALLRGVRFEGLQEVRTIGEVLTGEVRELVRKAWGVPVTDAYSTDEVGYLALQCPEGTHYHVQSESVLVEVLDEQGRACPPGAVGRIVVTTLHNFAMPLVRYDIGDYAEVGAACRCGRGLPVLTRIMGRVRNMLRLASGEAYWPLFGARSFDEIAPVLQCQFVQKTFDTLEARLVTSAPLTAEQEGRLRSKILSRLPAGLQLSFTYVREVPRGAGGKFEDFICEIAP